MPIYQSIRTGRKLFAHPPPEGRAGFWTGRLYLDLFALPPGSVAKNERGGTRSCVSFPDEMYVSQRFIHLVLLAIQWWPENESCGENDLIAT